MWTTPSPSLMGTSSSMTIFRVRCFTPLHSRSRAHARSTHSAGCNRLARGRSTLTTDRQPQRLGVALYPGGPEPPGLRHAPAGEWPLRAPLCVRFCVRSLTLHDRRAWPQYAASLKTVRQTCATRTLSPPASSCASPSLLRSACAACTCTPSDGQAARSRRRTALQSYVKAVRGADASE